MKHIQKKYHVLLLFLMLFALSVPMSTFAAAPKNQIVTKGDQYYYYNKDGTLVKHKFITLNGNTYYCYASDGHLAKGGFFTVAGQTYYANANGVVARNRFVKDGDYYYYFDQTGVIVKKKFITHNGNLYYCYSSTGRVARNGLFTVQDQYYYADNHGILARDQFVTIDNKRYFFNKKGIRQTGWINHGGHTYYCPASGTAYKSCWKTIGGNTYYFTKDYYIRKSKWVDNYYVDANGHRTNIQIPEGTPAKKKIIKMANIKQHPQLPTGCESVALTMVLQHMGFKLSKTTIASSYLPKSGSNFVTAFWGSPFSSSGAGIYAPGLKITANKYLQAKKSTKKAYDITGIRFSELYRYIDNNIPVIVWNSMYMRTPSGIATYRINGKTWTFYSAEHCVVFCGYDKEHNKVLINDSLSGLVWRNASSFERIYNKMGKMAVIIN